MNNFVFIFDFGRLKNENKRGKYENNKNISLMKPLTLESLKCSSNVSVLTMFDYMSS